MSIQFPEQAVNIKDFVLDEAIEVASFDPKKVLTAQDWDKILTSIDGLKEFDSFNNNWKLFLEMAADVTILDSAKLSLDDNFWKVIFGQLKSLEIQDRDKMNPSLPREMSNLRIFSPYNASLYPVRSDYLEWLKETMPLRRPYPSTIKNLAEIAIAFPGQVNYPFTARQIRVEANRINRTAEIVHAQLQEGPDLVGYLEDLVNFRILFPDQFRQWNLVPPWIWEVGKKRVAQDREWDNKEFTILDMATKLTILAAERIEINEQDGLKLTMPSPRGLTAQQPAIPENRKF